MHGAYVLSCEDTKIQRSYNALLSRGARDIGVVQEQHEMLTPVCKRLGGGNGCVRCAPARVVCTTSCDLHQQREYSESEDTLLLPSESEALSDAMVVRRPEGVSGSVAMAIRWDRCHGGAAWNIHPPASFPRFPLLSASLPRPSLPSLSSSLSFPLFLPLFLPPLLPSLSPFAFFSPVYIRIHSAVLPVVPPTTFLIVLAGPFASFVPKLTPFQRRQRWLALASLLFPPSPTSNRASSTTRFYFVTVSLIPVLCCTALYVVFAVLLCDNDR